MIAFIGAMEIEVQAIAELMTEVEHQVVSGIDFYLGKLSGKECVVVRSGVGKTAAAMSTTILMENFEVTAVVNVGTAGGLQEDMKVLDAVISLQIVHHDIDIPGWEKGFDLNERCYYASEELVRIMRLAVQGEESSVWFGNMVTGDSFVYKDEQFNEIMKNYSGALCAEMEGASIAQVCQHYEKPFIIIRSLSDIVHHEENGMTFDEYAERASKRSALWCQKFVEVKG